MTAISPPPSQPSLPQSPFREDFSRPGSPSLMSVLVFVVAFVALAPVDTSFPGSLLEGRVSEVLIVGSSSPLPVWSSLLLSAVEGSAVAVTLVGGICGRETASAQYGHT